MFRSINANIPNLFKSTTVAGSVPVGSTGNVTLISSQNTAIYVFGYSLGAASTIGNAGVVVRMLSGSTTAECWRTTLNGASSAAVGVDEMYVNPPSYLFRTNPGDPLTYEKGASSVANALNHFAFMFWRA